MVCKFASVVVAKVVGGAGGWSCMSQRSVSRHNVNKLLTLLFAEILHVVLTNGCGIFLVVSYPQQ